MIAQQNYQAGIYARLSKDDDTDGESVSIENQKLLLTQYAKERGLEVVDYYVEFSGFARIFRNRKIISLASDCTQFLRRLCARWGF